MVDTLRVVIGADLLSIEKISLSMFKVGSREVSGMVAENCRNI